MATFARQPTRRQALHDLRQQSVLLALDPRVQRRRVIAGLAPAPRTCAMIGPPSSAGVDEVDGHAADLHAVRERLRGRVDAGERGQQRRVRVDDAQRKAIDEVRASARA